MPTLDFSHLHLHTHVGSLLDGAIKIPQLFKRCADLGMSSIAITDHGSLAGVFDFYREGKKTGIKPIIGLEAYTTEDADDAETRTRDNYHLILLARNETGYRNLLALQSHAAQHNYHYRPRISWAQLERHRDGLIATTACLAGQLSRTILKADKPIVAGIEFLSRLRWIFGSNLYIELQHHPGIPDQERFNSLALELAQLEGIKTIITADAHYLSPADKPTHDLLMAIQLKKTVDEYCGSEMNVYQDTYIASPEEMLTSARTIGAEEAFYNTLDLAGSCQVELSFGGMKFPNYNVKQDTDYKEYFYATRPSKETIIS